MMEAAVSAGQEVQKTIRNRFTTPWSRAGGVALRLLMHVRRGVVKPIP